tara:strand:- start:5794 stop:5997 length:204 start_codon:yes stop_codon:yes gene_type:complete
MKLTDKEVLSKAGEMVTEYVTTLQAEGMSFEEKTLDLEETGRLFEGAARIIRMMIKNQLPKVDDTIH